MVTRRPIETSSCNEMFRSPCPHRPGREANVALSTHSLDLSRHVLHNSQVISELRPGAHLRTLQSRSPQDKVSVRALENHLSFCMPDGPPTAITLQMACWTFVVRT